MQKKLMRIVAGAVVTSGLALGVFAHDGKHPEKKAAAPGAAPAAAAAEAKTTSMEGELIDSACYVAAEGEAKGAGHAACARKCLGSGVPAAILPAGSKDPRAALFLLTNPVPLAPYAGQTIKVEGTMAGDFQAFDVKKAFVKEAHGWKEVQLQDEHHKMAGGGHGEGHGAAHGAGHGAGHGATPATKPAGAPAHKH